MKKTNCPKIIFIIGGLFSGIGKGIFTSSLASVLKSTKLKIAIQKIDPYLNIDSGFMNPHEHGEVFVTKDGVETDLDLGNYERFLGEKLTHHSSLTSGKIYWEVLQKERKGSYLGETINIYNISEMIKQKIFSFIKKSQCDILLVELGGTLGDNDLYPYLIALAQIKKILNKDGERNVAFIFLSYVVFLSTIQTFKTKLTQNSIFNLRNSGLEPDFLILRSFKPLDNFVFKKIAQKCYLDIKNIYELPNQKNIYKIPEILNHSHLIKNILTFLDLNVNAKITAWKKFNQKAQLLLTTAKKVKVAVVSKYHNFEQSFLSLWHAFYAASVEKNIVFQYQEINARSLNPKNVETILANFDAILVTGGFGLKGVEGKMLAANYARVHHKPFLAICFGFQIALIEIARNVLGWKQATSQEFLNSKDQKKQNIPQIFQYYDHLDKKMLIGEHWTELVAGTKIAQFYQQPKVPERYRNRFAFNNQYYDDFTKQGGVTFAGFVKNKTKTWTIFELNNHPFFVGIQYHCEFNFYPNAPHPIVASFLEKIWENKK